MCFVFVSSQADSPKSPSFVSACCPPPESDTSQAPMGWGKRVPLRISCRCGLSHQRPTRLRVIKKIRAGLWGKCGCGRGCKGRVRLSSQAWWYTPAISALGQGDYKLEASLMYIEELSLKNLERETETKVGFQKKHGGKQRVPWEDVH